MNKQNENKQETLASTTTSQTTATTTTVGTGTINMQYGWVCPKCGKVHAPWKDSCDCYLNTPYTPPNTTPINPNPAPDPFNPMPSWPQAPKVGDDPGWWWKYGPKCVDPIPCGGNISSDDTVSKLQIYNDDSKLQIYSTESISTANADSPDIAAIKAISEVVNDNISVPLKDLDRVFNDKLNLKTTKKI